MTATEKQYGKAAHDPEINQQMKVMAASKGISLKQAYDEACEEWLLKQSGKPKPLTVTR